MTRSEGACSWCGRRTLARDRVCPECVGVDRRADREPGPEHELRGGRWVRRGSIVVWQPNPSRLLVLNQPTLAEAAREIVEAVA